MPLSEPAKFLDPQSAALAAAVFERAICAVAAGEIEASAHWIRRTLAKKIIEDIFTGERNASRLTRQALAHLHASARVDVREPEPFLSGALESEEAEEALMPIDKDRVEGSAKNMKGKAKEGFGKLTGDAKTEAEGRAEQSKGKAQNAAGSVKDTLRGR